MAKKYWWLLFVGALLIGFLLLWINRFAVSDWLVLRSYQPSKQIEDLANGSGMNEYGKRLFYVGNPTITSGQEFNETCRDYEETKVLGCIVDGQLTGFSLVGGGKYNIYILNVTEPSLSGIQEVTAAHEMLHAAYSRLSANERQSLDEELNRVYNNLKNEKLADLLYSYANKDPNVVNNELHSLLGTEVANIGPVLEKHYSKYFTDRSKVVDLFSNYEKVFDNAKNEAERVYGSIKILEGQILSNRGSLDTMAAELESSRKVLEQLRASGQTNAYNNQVPIYNQAVNEYNQEVAEIRRLFDNYNQLVKQYDSLIVKQKELVDAIDSNVIPETKL